MNRKIFENVGAFPAGVLLIFRKNKLFFRKINMAAAGKAPTFSENFLFMHRSPCE